MSQHSHFLLVARKLQQRAEFLEGKPLIPGGRAFSVLSLPRAPQSWAAHSPQPWEEAPAGSRSDEEQPFLGLFWFLLAAPLSEESSGCASWVSRQNLAGWECERGPPCPGRGSEAPCSLKLAACSLTRTGPQAPTQPAALGFRVIPNPFWFQLSLPKTSIKCGHFVFGLSKQRAENALEPYYPILL